MKTQFWHRYRPSIPVSYIEETLAFEDEDECKDFLAEQEVAIITSEGGKLEIDCKTSYPLLIDKFSSLGIVDIKGQL